MAVVLRHLRLLLIALAVFAAMPGATATPVGAQSASIGAPDYDAWDAVATRAENAVANARASDDAFRALRAEIVGWREQLLAAQGQNSARIATVRSQIDALGAPPAEGEPAEAPEVTTRRQDLNTTLSDLQAPGRRAEVAFQRAEGIIREIDAILRERQADALMERNAAPVNPATWIRAGGSVSTSFSGALKEVKDNWNNPVRRAALSNDLPVIIGLAIFALVLLLRGRHWMDRLTARVFTRFGSRLVGLIVSTGQVLVPLAGLVLLITALASTGLLGLRGTALLQALPGLLVSVFVARWIAGRIFPKDSVSLLAGNVTLDVASAMRWRAAGLGLAVGVVHLAEALAMHDNYSGDIQAVVFMPVLAVLGFLLFRFGQTLQAIARSQQGEAGGGGFQSSVLSVIARATMSIGLLGPLLALAGYTAAAQMLLVPGTLTLGLMGVLLILGRLVSDLYMLVTGFDEAETSAALFPTLVNFALILAAAPVAALIWGARVTDLTEVLTRIQAGFTIGDTRIQPSDFLLFLVVFAIGYTATRMVQNGLKNAVLPKTRLDPGGRNAILSGVGYLGIFLAALIAITAAGINLSALAVVAGALSVGIGFGLRAVVENFVAGIILLVERPIGEGDWIEVGGNMGIVKAISVRSTRIETFDKTQVVIPNADFISGTVTNWTRGNRAGRLIVPVGVAYGSDTRKVSAILEEIAHGQPLVMLEPAPMILFAGFGADSLDFEMRVILSDINFGVQVRNEINHQIAERFVAEGIEIPYAQRDIWIRNPEALAGVAAAVSPAPAAARMPDQSARAQFTQQDMGAGDVPDGTGDGR